MNRHQYLDTNISLVHFAPTLTRARRQRNEYTWHSAFAFVSF
jgi:hypothetical protein